jgi:hypothetical protein
VAGILSDREGPTRLGNFPRGTIMAQRFETHLRDSGYDMDLETFRDLLIDVLHNMYRNWDDEDLLHHPQEALAFCRVVRQTAGCARLSDDLILRVLSSTHKQFT